MSASQQDPPPLVRPSVTLIRPAARTAGTLCHGELCVQSSTEGTLKNILHLQAGSGSGMLVVELNVVFTGPTGDYKAIRHVYCSRICGWNCKGDGSIH